MSARRPMSVRGPLVLCFLLGATLATTAGAQVTATLGTNDTRLQGASADGRPLVYTPDPYEQGSSVSHWDARAFPNLLMEPSINGDLEILDVDLTEPAFEDLGWPVPGELQTVTKAATFNLWTTGDAFSDPTPFAGAPGNDAATLGEARTNLFNAVFTRWGQVIESSVAIDVIVLWQSLPCDETGGALAAASPTFVAYSDIDEFPFNHTWYHIAQGEAILGEDLSGSPTNGGGDIVVTMNLDIDSGCLGTGTSFYYGLDGNEGTNQIDAATVVLHELAHGLGFSTLTNGQNGSFNDGMPSAFDHFLVDLDGGKKWAEMTAAERMDSAVNFGRLAWDGTATKLAAENLLAPGVPELVVSSPASIAGAYDVGTADFGGSLETTLNGEIGCYRDAEGDPFDACSAPSDPSALAGKIAILSRGTCTFAEKAANAQAAGATAVVVVNNAGNATVQMNGTDPSIVVPVVSVGQSSGEAIQEVACADENAVLLRSGRFQVTARQDDGNGFQPAPPVQLTDDTAYFWFFDADNVEVVVKVLDGCGLNDHYWVFASGLTNVGVELTVTDLQTGETKVYENPRDQDFRLIKDTSAFACP